MTRDAVVIGAGIGGLATAVGLSASGWRVRVLERAAALRPVGGGIGLTPNGIRALRALGAAERVTEAAVEQTHGGVRSPDGTWISHTDLDFISNRYGDPVVAIHRATLLDVLCGLLAPGVLRTGTTVLSVQPGDRATVATVHTGDGTLRADLVVAADGIHSAVRGALFPDNPGPSFAGYTSWRMVVDVPDTPLAGETWGRGKRFSILPLPGGLVHCSALAVAEPSAPAREDAAALAGHFGSWHSPIPELIAAARGDEVLHHDIEELTTRLSCFHAGRVVLVGDAAHAMTPNLGLACLALEDAVTIAALVGAASSADVTGRLARFTLARSRRSAALARLSRRIGRMGALRFPPAVAARDVGFRIAGISPKLTVRTLDQLMDWRPPAA